MAKIAHPPGGAAQLLQLFQDLIASSPFLWLSLSLHRGITQGGFDGGETRRGLPPANGEDGAGGAEDPDVERSIARLPFLGHQRFLEIYYMIAFTERTPWLVGSKGT